MSQQKPGSKQVGLNHVESDQVWDVAVVGGGYAGLSGVLTLARARRSVIVLDGGRPRNAPAQSAHGLLGQEGVNPLELLARGREEASAYGARIVQADVSGVDMAREGGFVLRLHDGAQVRAGQLLIATGVRDELPPIPGLAARWGRDVVHCPYCHGWEIRDQRIGLLATGPMSAMQALLFHQWSDRMWFFSNELGYPAEQLEQLTAVGITIVPGRVFAVDVDVVNDRLAGVRLRDGIRVEVDALAVPALSHARLEGLEDLDVQLESGAAGVSVVADAMGHTSLQGVWAAGNVVNPALQISESAANGARVAMTINNELVLARANQAVQGLTHVGNHSGSDDMQATGE